MVHIYYSIQMIYSLLNTKFISFNNKHVLLEIDEISFKLPFLMFSLLNILYHDLWWIYNGLLLCKILIHYSICTFHFSFMLIDWWNVPTLEGLVFQLPWLLYFYNCYTLNTVATLLLTLFCYVVTFLLAFSLNFRWSLHAQF